MQLLDATLAMALTLAALATIVTIIMEAGLRAARVRKKNLIEVMKLLNNELDKGPLKALNPGERWTFISGVVENPLKAVSGQLQSHLDQTSRLARFSSSIMNLFGFGTPSNESTIKSSDNLKTEDLNHYLSLLGQDSTSNKRFTQKLIGFISQFFGDKKRKNLYDKVSLEHVLRRLTEVEKVVEELSKTTGDNIKTELNRLARKYEEFGSAVSANFKRSSQAWSIVVGILFAVLVNVDGLRIFEVYQTDHELALKVIEQEKVFNQNVVVAGKLKEQRSKLEENVTKAMKELKLAEGNKKNIEAKQKALAAAQSALDDITSVEQIKQTAERVQQQYSYLASLGIPLGWELYPNCPYGKDGSAWEKSDTSCRVLNDTQRKRWEMSEGSGWWTKQLNSIKKRLNSDNPFSHAITTAIHDPKGFIRWLFTAIVTGLLIGLGAPFWFDVAKRLAQIRQGLREKASDEGRMSASNANGDAEKRTNIVNRVVADTKTESKAGVKN